MSGDKVQVRFAVARLRVFHAPPMKVIAVPRPPLIFIVLAALLLAALIQLEVLQVAFDKLGLPANSFLLLLVASAFGSMVNVPLFALAANASAQEEILRRLPEALRRRMKVLPGKTVVAINVGGCLVPMLLSVYLVVHTPLSFEQLLPAIALVSLVAYYGSVLVPNVGVIMPILAAPFAAAFVGESLDAEHAAPLAYVSGTLGVLLGADLLRLRELGHSGEPIVSIGGAGSFDGIFLTGILAVLIT